MRSLKLTCKRANPVLLVQSLIRASPAGEDKDYHSYYCQANYQTSWTQEGEVSQLSLLLREVFSNDFRSCYCSWESCPQRLRQDPTPHSFLNSPRAFGAAPHSIHPHRAFAVAKSSLKTWVLLWRTGVSDTPPLQDTLRTIIWLSETIARISEKISLYYAMQCRIFYNRYYLSDQLKLLTMVSWASLYIKQ